MKSDVDERGRDGKMQSIYVCVCTSYFLLTFIILGNFHYYFLTQTQLTQLLIIKSTFIQDWKYSDGYFYSRIHWEKIWWALKKKFSMIKNNKNLAKRVMRELRVSYQKIIMFFCYALSHYISLSIRTRVHGTHSCENYSHVHFILCDMYYYKYDINICIIYKKSNTDDERNCDVRTIRLFFITKVQNIHDTFFYVNLTSRLFTFSFVMCVFCWL